METRTTGGQLMENIDKSTVGYIRAVARELLVAGRCKDVYEAIQIAEDLIAETTYTQKGNTNDLDNNKYKRK